HLMVGRNVVMRKDGGRQCRECMALQRRDPAVRARKKLYNRAYHAAHREELRVKEQMRQSRHGNEINARRRGGYNKSTSLRERNHARDSAYARRPEVRERRNSQARTRYAAKKAAKQQGEAA